MRLPNYALGLLFVALFAATMLGRHHRAHGEELTGIRKYMAMTCDDVRAYMATHTVAEAKAEAAANHLPQWLIKRAKACLPEN